MADPNTATTALDGVALARRCAESMYARDTATRELGMTLETVAPGCAILCMPIRDDMIQGHGSCHGGFIFALADSAFAFACNTYNEATVAAGCSIEYVSPGLPGDVLTAEARELTRKGRTGVYDVRVTGGDGQLVALFRGKSYRVRGPVIHDEESQA
ncbi:phenylacetic acid degradation protein PaaD [Alcanivorax xiamenensis]|uniref:Phenylacetic acid degradation protein PaaD n=1 Tax=Alcanivorax xiamenensis TaxID=1177156 RepID=A0ABQ6YCT6_9GAMM|nr:MULTISPECIES: hydroxyphenylacetyl-CoA thioesterase PaaI [Alcanivorax]KAF0807627.1 phenylacetic acid degradation protein PaaD [Alcanivorax xiamenensis]